MSMTDYQVLIYWLFVATRVVVLNKWLKVAQETGPTLHIKHHPVIYPASVWELNLESFALWVFFFPWKQEIES